jgi:prevent-host-death family protein
MAERAMGIEEARAKLGDLVSDAQHGIATPITRNGRPAALLMPDTAAERRTSMTADTYYKMTPGEDTILYSDELRDGMRVIHQPHLRQEDGPEEEQARAQQFCRVTKLRISGDAVNFVGVWDDGHQEMLGPLGRSVGWIVKLDSIPGAECAPAQAGESGQP